jgi:hypothetical protein
LREQLLHRLAEAAEIEHNLLCSYLYAAFSLRGPGESLSGSEADAVDAWRRTIVSVAVEEMGHLATVSNLTVALGGTPHFDRPNFPVPAGYHPSGFALRLTPFDEATLQHFIFLERGDDASVADGEGFQESAAPGRTAGRLGLTPSARDYGTVGEFYRDLTREIRFFAGGERSAAFVCTERQASGEDLGVAGVVVIRDLASALAALRHVVEQGEGGRGLEDSHFARFCAIKAQWAELKQRNPAFMPAHPAARDPVMRRPEEELERVWIRAPAAAEMLDFGNAVYGVLLTLLAQIWAVSAAPQKRALMGAAMEAMHALSRAGRALARLPASEAACANAGLTFAVPRAQGPRAGLRVLVERLEELAPAHERLFPGADNALRKAARRLGEEGA